ncbi:DUF1385 domain-containing protein [Candidatus Woesearchaeota archaeon]|jgi:uncharacterized protein YqhQ|nr:DUF1385 domain-containing protein [Candidatus Woesearchaeota archaeon]MBT4150562.1 DUF1385 domain-containing protein [Candidatus Woesearchaeota archaeon]MBT4247671.1 DUF1385 domain-containing protein [Candidatus Woesearchaeota archaeon]MBT4434049.1 DUF1385 domain-containing protein [Candidatus Woesearchaeota archaeon]MBT7332264.1 DUF1385 domain-containing protein [Candidatus Woesearchaeota archaeon]
MDVGGQAVIEGVMMRNKERFAVAVRLPDGTIKVKEEKNSKFPKIFNKFFIRGIVGLGYTLYDGVRALIWSSNQNLGVEEKLSKKEVITTVSLSFLASAVIFVLIPFLSAKYLAPSGIWFDVLDGIFRVGLFVGYLLLISMMQDVKTLFSYHGAEHKAIYCYEEKQPLTVENVKKFTRFHPRCGTTFIFIVLLLSIFLFVLIPGGFLMKFVGRLLLLPVLAGTGYELIKLSGKYHKNIIVKILISPGLWLQRITTNEPTDKQLEVSIKALKAVVD